MASITRSKLAVYLDIFIESPLKLVQYRTLVVKPVYGCKVIDEVAKRVNNIYPQMDRSQLENYLGWSLGFNIIEG